MAGRPIRLSNGEAGLVVNGFKPGRLIVRLAYNTPSAPALNRLGRSGLTCVKGDIR